MPAPTGSLKLDPEIKTRLQRLAAARRRSQHWLMREAIEQYVEREEQRQRLRDEALAAWTEYQETGLHATGDGSTPGWPASKRARIPNRRPHTSRSCRSWFGARPRFETLLACISF